MPRVTRDRRRPGGDGRVFWAPCLQDPQPRPPASPPRPRALPPRPATQRQGRSQGRGPRSPCRRSSSGSSGSGRRSPCQWCTAPHSPPPESAWPGPPRDSRRSRCSPELHSPTQTLLRACCLAAQRPAPFNRRGPGTRNLLARSEEMLLSDWPKETQHPRHPGKRVSLGNRVGVGVLFQPLERRS